MMGANSTGILANLKHTEVAGGMHSCRHACSTEKSREQGPTLHTVTETTAEEENIWHYSIVAPLLSQKSLVLNDLFFEGLRS